MSSSFTLLSLNVLIFLILIIVFLLVIVIILNNKLRTAKTASKQTINVNSDILTSVPVRPPATVTKAKESEVLCTDNELLNSIVDQLLKYDNSFAREDIVNFIRNINNTSLKRIITIKNIYDDKIINYLFENLTDHKTFLHYTADEDVALKIVNTGFRFSNAFLNTARELNKNRADFDFKHNQQKYFGYFIVVICISRELHNFYSNEFMKKCNTHVDVEQILTDQPMLENEDYEMVSVLPIQFIKGFVNYQTNEIVSNPSFDPKYNPDQFMKNLDKLGNRLNDKKVQG